MPKLRPAQPELLSIFTEAAASVASMVATPLYTNIFLELTFAGLARKLRTGAGADPEFGKGDALC